MMQRLRETPYSLCHSMYRVLKLCSYPCKNKTTDTLSILHVATVSTGSCWQLDKEEELIGLMKEINGYFGIVDNYINVYLRCSSNADPI